MSETSELAGSAPASSEPVPGIEPVRTLPPPVVLDIGTILTLRKAGHLRSPTPGQEYFAPAVVLAQYESDGSIDALVWDASAGAHFVSAYPVRDVDARTDVHNRREMYVKRSNIGEILFSPGVFKSIEDGMDTLAIGHARMRQALAEQNTELESLRSRMAAVELFMKQFEPQSTLATGTGLTGGLSDQQAAAPDVSQLAEPAAAPRDRQTDSPRSGQKSRS